MTNAKKKTYFLTGSPQIHWFKNKTRNPIKEQSSTNSSAAFVVTAELLTAAIGQVLHTGKDAIGRLQDDASLPPWQHCFLMVLEGGGEEGRGTHPTHSAIFHLLSGMKRRKVDAVMDRTPRQWRAGGWKSPFPWLGGRGGW